MSSLPTIIFVHGSWHSPPYFTKLIAVLEPLGYRCICVSLPSVGPMAGVKCMEDDSVVIRDAVVAQVETGREVVLALHSYAGIPGNNAIKDLGVVDRTRYGKPGGVRKIVMLSAMMIPDGCGGERSSGIIEPFWSIQGNVFYPNNPAKVFYNDLDPAEAAYWVAQLRPSSFPVNVPTYAGWKDLPVAYLVCENDQAVKVEVQEAMKASCRRSGADIEVERCGASHTPFLSMPELVVNFIRRAAGEELQDINTTAL